MKSLTVIGGIGLAILWLAGLSGAQDSATWLTWLDALAAVGAFFVAGLTTTRQNAMGGTGAIAAGTLILWLVGLTTNGAPWQNWWTFVFGCLLVVSAIAAARGKTARIESGSTAHRIQEEAERDRFRKGA